jgi:hypothetical protein
MEIHMFIIRILEDLKYMKVKLNIDILNFKVLKHNIEITVRCHF